MPYRLVGIIVLSVLLLSTALVQRAYGAFFDPYCPPCPPWGQVPYQVPYLSPEGVQFDSDPLFLPPDVARALGYKVLPPPRSQGGRGQDLLGGVRVGEVLTPLGGRSTLSGGKRVGKGRFGGQPSSVFDRVPGLTGGNPEEGSGDTPSNPCVSFFDLVPGLTGPRKISNETIFGPIPDLFEKNCRQQNRRKKPTGGFF